MVYVAKPEFMFASLETLVDTIVEGVVIWTDIPDARVSMENESLLYVVIEKELTTLVLIGFVNRVYILREMLVPTAMAPL